MARITKDVISINSHKMLVLSLLWSRTKISRGYKKVTKTNWFSTLY